MSRVIKFRAWDSKNNKMIFPMSFQNGVGCIIPNDYLSYSDTEVYLGCRSQYKLMEYTGFTDKNSKEIYEEDIVKYQSKSIFKIIFEDGSFKISCIKNNKHSLLFIDVDFNEIEVIRNIYEN